MPAPYFKKHILSSLSYWRFYLYNAYLLLFIKYKKTKLGILWEPLTTMIGVFFIAILWTVILKAKGTFFDFYIYLLTGFTLWGFLSQAITNSSSCFISFHKKIRSESRSLYFYIIQSLMLHFTKMLISLGITLLIIFLSGNFSFILNFPLFIVYSVSLVIGAVGVCSILSVAVTMKRDMIFIIRSIMRVAFFLTPIIWTIDRLAPYEILAWLNPAFTYLYLFRNLMLTTEPVYGVLLANFILSVCFFIIGNLMLSRFDNRIRTRVSNG